VVDCCAINLTVAGPVYYKGYYHLFYQYNPNAAIPGTIEWGHVVSKDLIRWRFLESALKRDKWYDVNGVWSGSITFLDNGDPVILYTGNSVNNTQSQNRADPADPSDPLLRKWVKVSQCLPSLQFLPCNNNVCSINQVCGCNSAMLDWCLVL
jgi:hypothetical protein